MASSWDDARDRYYISTVNHRHNLQLVVESLGQMLDYANGSKSKAKEVYYKALSEIDQSDTYNVRSALQQIADKANRLM